MNKILGILIIFLISLLILSCRAQHCNLHGNWVITHGFPTRNFAMAKPYSKNIISFSIDSVKLASGFFYNTINWNDEYPQGRYPFMYYGNKEKYKIEGDSLHIYSNPYHSWHSFKLSCIHLDKIELIAKDDTIKLQRLAKVNEKYSCSIKYVRAHVQEGDLSLFKNNYMVTFTNDNNLLYEGPNPEGDNIRKRFHLKPGTFNDICLGFKFVNLATLKNLYETQVSEINNIALEIGLENGQVIKTDIQNMNCPDELRLALIPVLYSHQQYVYPNLKPIKY